MRGGRGAGGWPSARPLQAGTSRPLRTHARLCQPLRALTQARFVSRDSHPMTILVLDDAFTSASTMLFYIPSLLYNNAQPAAASLTRPPTSSDHTSLPASERASGNVSLTNASSRRPNSFLSSAPSPRRANSTSARRTFPHRCHTHRRTRMPAVRRTWPRYSSQSASRARARARAPPPWPARIRSRAAPPSRARARAAARAARRS